MATKTNSGLITYAAAQIGKPYWYGCYGQTATAALLESKKASYPSYYTASDFESQLGQRVHDCSGLIKGYLWSSTATSTPVYKAAQDLSAAAMYAACTTGGKMSTFDKVDGRLLFKGSTAAKITHVGIYSAGYVIEAKGHAYGVTMSAYKASAWNFWGQHPDITDDTSGSSTTTSTTEATTVSTKKVTQYAGIVKVSDYLNVRKGPGTSYGYYTVSGTQLRLPNGMVISIEEESADGAWGKLTNVDDAWVCLTYVTH